jgi:hypothetical protein
MPRKGAHPALAPLAAPGYRRGWVSLYDVELTDGIHRISIPRGGWTAAANIEAAAEPEDREELSGEETSMLHELMRTDVADLSQEAVGFLG